MKSRVAAITAAVVAAACDSGLSTPSDTGNCQAMKLIPVAVQAYVQYVDIRDLAIQQRVRGASFILLAKHANYDQGSQRRKTKVL